MFDIAKDVFNNFSKQLYPSKKSTISTHIMLIENHHLNAVSFPPFKWKLANCIFHQESTCRDQIFNKVEVRDSSETRLCPFSDTSMYLLGKMKKIIIPCAFKKISWDKIKP